MNIKENQTGYHGYPVKYQKLRNNIFLVVLHLAFQQIQLLFTGVIPNDFEHCRYNILVCSWLISIILEKNTNFRTGLSQTINFFYFMLNLLEVKSCLKFVIF